jgi:hypothetical protein
MGIVALDEHFTRPRERCELDERSERLCLFQFEGALSQSLVVQA